MKKIFLTVIATFAITYFADAGANGRLNLPVNAGSPTSSIVSTFAKNQQDTVVWTREAGVSAISFMIHCKDSVRFANDSGCVILRVVDGTAQKIAGDTLNLSSKISVVDGNASTLSFADGVVYTFTPTFSPYSDHIVFIVKYGIAGCGTTTPTVRYQVNKVYAK